MSREQIERARSKEEIYRVKSREASPQVQVRYIAMNSKQSPSIPERRYKARLESLTYYMDPLPSCSPNVSPILPHTCECQYSLELSSSVSEGLLFNWNNNYMTMSMPCAMSSLPIPHVCRHNAVYVKTQLHQYHACTDSSLFPSPHHHTQ